MSKWNLAGPLLVVALAVLSFFVLQRQTRSPGLMAAQEPTAAAVGDSAPPPQRRVSLDVSAGIVGTRFLVTNGGSQTLRNLSIRVNEADPNGQFSMTMGHIGPNQQQHFDAGRLVRADGRSFEPGKDYIDTVTIVADTPDGRGSWTGSY